MRCSVMCSWYVRAGLAKAEGVTRVLEWILLRRALRLGCILATVDDLRRARATDCAWTLKTVNRQYDK